MHVGRPNSRRNVLPSTMSVCQKTKNAFLNKLPAYHDEIANWMIKEKPYLNPSFKLMDVSNILPLNRTYLSRVFNDGFGESFSNVVRNYRIPRGGMDADQSQGYSRGTSRANCAVLPLPLPSTVLLCRVMTDLPPTVTANKRKENNFHRNFCQTVPERIFLQFVNFIICKLYFTNCKHKFTKEERSL